ncbi:MAG: hypothetical protein ACM31O_00010 [Bacteroidota bacterium]
MRKQLVQPGCQKTLTGSSGVVGFVLMRAAIAPRCDRFNLARCGVAA